MESPQFFLYALNYADKALRRALEELTPEELRMQPAGPDSNPIGWLAWHLTRVQDNSGSALLGKELAWVADGWHEKFGLGSDSRKFTGFTIEEVKAFDPIDGKTLLGYYECVNGHTQELVNRLTTEGMSKEIPADPGRPNTVGTRLAVAMGDNIQHIGQISYVMGLIKGHGWYGR